MTSIKRIDRKEFNRIFIEEVTILNNYPLISETNVKKVVKGLISIINKAVDGSILWGRPSV